MVKIERIIIIIILGTLFFSAFLLIGLQIDLRNTNERLSIVEVVLSGLTQENANLRAQVREFVDKWDVGIFETTAYAPMDPSAVEGMCFSGDPRITASGARVEPGVTVAAGRNLPFGTRIYIHGIGWREVQDRGGMIGNNNIDIAVDTLEEAYRIGRQKAVVVWEG